MSNSSRARRARRPAAPSWLRQALAWGLGLALDYLLEWEAWLDFVRSGAGLLLAFPDLRGQQRPPLPPAAPAPRPDPVVEVFKTTVADPGAARLLLRKLRRRFPARRITFDLEDCDRILRIAGAPVCLREVTRQLNDAGFSCSPLEE